MPGGRKPPVPSKETTMTATSLLIHAGFITGLALAMITGLALT